MNNEQTRDADPTAAIEQETQSPSEEETMEDTEPQNTEATESPNAEAAKYRRRLRDAETQLETASNTISSLQTQIINSHIESQHYKTAAFWAGGNQLEDLTNEDGTVDLQRVQDALTRTAEMLGVKPNRFGVNPDMGPIGERISKPDTPNWGHLMKQDS